MAGGLREDGVASRDIACRASSLRRGPRCDGGFDAKSLATRSIATLGSRAGVASWAVSRDRVALWSSGATGAGKPEPTPRIVLSRAGPTDTMGATGAG